MFTRCHQRKSEGFTLIELLVVVAIIGILAALLFPAIQGALVKAKAVKVGSNGRQVHLGIFDENLSNDALDEPPIWPLSAANFDPADYPDGFDVACQNSTEYFKWAWTNQIIKGVDFTFFAAPGVAPTPAYADFDDGNNAWCFTLDLNDDSLSANVPFMFSKNLNLTANSINSLDESEPLLAKRGNEKMPFGDSLAVVVTRGGGVKVLPKKILTDDAGSSSRRGKEAFNPDNTDLPFITPTGVGTF
jgi:prepilin-type N-terminal cleavage/methylation domain-containing protein